MHRLGSVLGVLALLFLLAQPARLAAQQQRPAQPPPGGRAGGGAGTEACGEGCGGGDNLAPFVTLVAPSGEVTTSTATITVDWCDDQSLSSASRWVKVNGVSQTTDYVNSTPLQDCGVRKKSTATSVSLNVGANTVQGHICDNASNCTTETFTIYRVQAGVPTIALKNQNGDNLDRGLCLTTGAGAAAGLSCGDLFVAHGMPAYRTMGRDRSLTLVYSSAAAAPRPLVAVTVSQATGRQTPTNTAAELRIYSGGGWSTRASATYNPVAAGTPRQLALAFDASGDASGIYPFRLLVSNQYSGVGTWTDSISGELLIANRSGSEFGAGWWLGGVEQLLPGQSANRLVWLGADGSAAVYDSLAAGVWRRASGPFRDSLTYASGEYTRHLRHGVTVVFDASGRHVRTVNRAGHTTTFTWTGSPVRLTSIQVPPGGSGTTYSLAYEGTYRYLDYIDDPASRRLDAYVATNLYGSVYTITSLTDPDAVGVAFTYDGAGRMLTRQDRMGVSTTYSYDYALHVTRITTPLEASVTAIDSLSWWDEAGLAIGSPGGTLTAVDTSAVYTRLNGPRTDSADVARLWVDRWGAPVRIVGPVNDTTLIQRSTATGLVGRLETPIHRIIGLTYDGRGNLVSQTDSTHEGHGTGGFQAATVRYTYHSSQTPDAPDSIIDPEGVVTRFVYNALGFDSLAIAPTGQVTRFAYGSGSTAGLVTSVTELQVPTYTDTTSWGTSTSNADLATQFSYSSLGNVETATSPMGSVSRYAYNAYTQVERTINSVGDTTRYFPRSMGVTDSVVQVAATGNRRTLMTYDAGLRRLSIADARGVARSWQYDLAGRDTAEVDDYGYRERRFFDAAGQVVLVRLRSGDTVRTVYDAAGRRTLTRYPARTAGDSARGDTVTVTYDAGGRLLTATNRSGSVTRQYYREGTLKQEQQVANAGVGGGFDVIGRYRYDRADRRTWYSDMCAAGGCTDSLVLTYTYTNGLPERIVINYPGASPANDTASYQWDGLGRRSLVVTPHHATMRWFYDLDGRLRRVYATHSCPGSCAAVDSAVVDEQYRAYDAGNRALNIVRWVGGVQNSETQEYDAFGQLTFQVQDGIRQDYTYDLSGNLLSDLHWSGGQPYGRKVVIDPGHNRMLADSTVSAATVVLNASYTYTVNGERIRDTPPTANQQWRRMYFDVLGKLTSVESYQVYQYNRAPDTEVNYYSYSGAIQANINSCRYDALGRQVKPCGGLAMSYDGDQVVRVRGSRLIYGPALGDLLAVYDSALGAGSYAQYYALTDGAGHLYSFTSADGADQREATNQVYMDRASFSGALVRGHRFSAAASESYASEDLSYFRNRYYDQRTGQWLTEDPIGVAGGLNLYGYVGNNPVTFTDPFGLCPPQDRNWTPACDKGLEPAGLADPTLWLIGGLVGGVRAVAGRLLAREVTTAAADALVTNATEAAGSRVAASFTEGQLGAVQRQLAEHGEAALGRSLRRWEGRLAEHIAEREEILARGGNANSVEREIRNFEGLINAGKHVLGIE